MVTRIVGDINATLVRKLEDLEHRVLMRIENLQRYEEATMGAITARVDALERSSSSLRFQNEMIQVSFHIQVFFRCSLVEKSWQ